jgi:Rap1a immunity proteins
MRKRHAIDIIAFFALLALQGIALAQSEDTASANAVMVGCRNFVINSNQEIFVQGGCVYRVSTIFHFRTRLGVCAPDGAGQQAIRVVVTYIDQRPARMHEQFEDLALEALTQAWPCRRQ